MGFYLDLMKHFIQSTKFLCTKVFTRFNERKWRRKWRTRKRKRRFYPGTRLGLVEGQEGETMKEILPGARDHERRLPLEWLYPIKWKLMGEGETRSGSNLPTVYPPASQESWVLSFTRLPDIGGGVPRTIPNLPFIIFSFTSYARSLTWHRLRRAEAILLTAISSCCLIAQRPSS